MRVLATTALMWSVFKLRIRIGDFDPDQYRREVALNTDFRKFDDGLMITADCPPEVIKKVSSACLPPRFLSLRSTA